MELWMAALTAAQMAAPWVLNWAVQRAVWKAVRSVASKAVHWVCPSVVSLAQLRVDRTAEHWAAR